MSPMIAMAISLVGLIVIITVQVVFFARWTGRIDGYVAASDQRFTAYILAADKRFEQNEDEIRRLRDARHAADGVLQRHEGQIKELNRRHFSRRHDDSSDGSEG